MLNRRGNGQPLQNGDAASESIPFLGLSAMARPQTESIDQSTLWELLRDISRNRSSNRNSLNRQNGNEIVDDVEIDRSNDNPNPNGALIAAPIAQPPQQSPNNQLLGMNGLEDDSETIIGIVCGLCCALIAIFVFKCAQVVVTINNIESECDCGANSYMVVYLTLPFIPFLLYLCGFCLIRFIYFENTESDTNSRRHSFEFLKRVIFNNSRQSFIENIWFSYGFFILMQCNECRFTAPTIFYIFLLTLLIGFVQRIARLYVYCKYGHWNVSRIAAQRLFNTLPPSLRNGRNGINGDTDLETGLRRFVSGTSQNILHRLPQRRFRMDSGNDDEKEVLLASSSSVSDTKSGSQSASDHSSTDDNDDIPKCAICLSHFKRNEMLRRLTCAHEFHTQCVDTWLAAHRTCPICRTDVVQAFRPPNV